MKSNNDIEKSHACDGGNHNVRINLLKECSFAITYFLGYISWLQVTREAVLKEASSALPRNHFRDIHD